MASSITTQISALDTLALTPTISLKDALPPLRKDGVSTNRTTMRQQSTPSTRIVPAMTEAMGVVIEVVAAGAVETLVVPVMEAVESHHCR